jgi:YidC/Oxa1 family membrane protein insertase
VDRRLALAIILMILVAVAPSLLRPRRPAPTAGRSDSAPTQRQPDTLAGAVPEVVQPQELPSLPSSDRAAAESSRLAPSDTVWVTSRLYRLGFSTLGGQLVHAELSEYRSLAVRDSGRLVQLVPEGRPFLAHRLLLPRAGAAAPDTVPLTEWRFTASEREVTVSNAAQVLTFTAARGAARVEVEYRFDPDEYRFAVRGRVLAPGLTGAVLALGLGDGLRSIEADTVDNYRNYAVVTKAAKTERRDFGSLDPGETQSVNGPFEWVGLKSKYFLYAALVTDQNASPFGGAIITGGPRTGKMATRAAVTATLTVPPTGQWSYQVYLGPIEYRRLTRIGHALDDANPYGGILRPVIHPISIFVLNILLWMHEQLGLAYGWVLVVFGVLVRILLWPLNQKAMESSLRMQAVAPLMKDVQERYKGDPERLQREMLKLYRDYKVNPFGGCLPMLLPLPVLFALFFVFQNTIEFRGVPFLWLPDLARHDPFYVIPVVMGLSMFAVSKIGQMGLPPTPQTKLMLYFLPAMMTFLFLRFASGLNLYYTVQNIVSIPQQYMLAKRRQREQGKPPRPPDKRDKS